MDDMNEMQFKKNRTHSTAGRGKVASTFSTHQTRNLRRQRDKNSNWPKVNTSSPPRRKRRIKTIVAIVIVNVIVAAIM
jgi:hypothetical protein